MPAETTRTLMKHGRTSATVTIPMDYRRYHRLNPGTRVRIIYDGFLLLIPPSSEKKARERAEAIRRLLE